MKLKARAQWDPLTIAGFNLPKNEGWLALQIAEPSRERLRQELTRMAKFQIKKFQEAAAKYDKARYEESLIELDVELTIHYRKRSVEANNLYWKLLEIEANYLNGTPLYREGYWSKKLPGRVITPEEIHEDDLETYCEKSSYFVPKGALFGFVRGMEQEVGKVVAKEPVGDGNTYKVDIWKTTSFMDKKEFSVWMTRLIERITEGGLLSSDVDEFIGLREDFKQIVSEGRK